MTLRLDWCSHEAARYAVEHWHYSRSMPVGPTVKIGVWEHGAFIGCVLFARGANREIGKPYGLSDTEVCELTRVALANHSAPVSRVIAIAITFLRKQSPGLRLIVSFADANQGHYGGIYQASNWLYLGCCSSREKYVDAMGRVWHSRQVSSVGVIRQFGVARRVPRISECIRVPQLPKHRYVMPLDAAMRSRLTPLAKPYPKRAGSIVADAPAVQAGEGGSVPTPALREAR